LRPGLARSQLLPELEQLREVGERQAHAPGLAVRPVDLFGQFGNDDFDGGDGIDLCRQGPGTGTIANCEA
jgi:hypothetical protein